MNMRGVSKAAGVAALVTALGLGAATNAFAWDSTWKTTGKKGQTTQTFKFKDSKKRFLHFGVTHNGKQKITAKAYKVVAGQGRKNDKLMQTLKAKDNGQSWMAPFKTYGKGSYYIVFDYSVKNKKAFGGVS